MDKRRTGESLKDLFKKEAGSTKSKSQRTKGRKRQNVKALKRNMKPRRHTLYLSPEQSKKLRVHAAQNDMQLSQVIGKLINDNL